MKVLWLLCLFVLVDCKTREAQRESRPDMAPPRFAVQQVPLGAGFVNKLIVSPPPDARSCEYQICENAGEDSCSLHHTSYIETYLFLSEAGSRTIDVRCCTQEHCDPWPQQNEPIEVPPYSEDLAAIIGEIAATENDVNRIFDRDKVLACFGSVPSFSLKFFQDAEAPVGGLATDYLVTEYQETEKIFAEPYDLKDAFFFEYFIFPRLYRGTQSIAQELKSRDVSVAEFVVPASLRPITLARETSTGLALAGPGAGGSTTPPAGGGGEHRSPSTRRYTRCQ